MKNSEIAAKNEIIKICASSGWRKINRKVFIYIESSRTIIKTIERSHKLFSLPSFLSASVLITILVLFFIAV